uniref:RRM domain-containing protein n=1 Tax=Timema cristinae TaxID=61476 RepID=A0A7R9CY16_TIMCR|nr:unnamed protein product [Timema cristinae]
MLRLIASCSLTSPAGHGKGGTLMPPPPFGPAATFAQFGHTPTQLIPAAPPLAARHTFPVAYPPIFYWPYPSPPVSPTSYYGGPMPAALGPPQGPMQPPQPTLVIMQGLPYSANVGHVLNFFSGSPELTPECIQLQRSMDGRATGEAIVCFPSRVEAERAVLEKNRQHIGNRYIELYLI